MTCPWLSSQPITMLAKSLATLSEYSRLLTNSSIRSKSASIGASTSTLASRPGATVAITSATANTRILIRILRFFVPMIIVSALPHSYVLSFPIYLCLAPPLSPISDKISSLSRKRKLSCFFPQVLRPERLHECEFVDSSSLLRRMSAVVPLIKSNSSLILSINRLLNLLPQNLTTWLD